MMKKNVNSFLIFLYTNNYTEICVNMELKGYKHILKINKEEYTNEKYDKENIEIVKSDKSGVGKSTQIKKSVEERGKKWEYFPFGGVLKRDEIIDRLMKLNVDNNCVIHLDLYDTDNTSLMIEFLFSFLILRYFGKDENVFYLPKDIEIKIEIPNSFINFMEKFQLLKLFKAKEMSISNLSPLIVEKNLYSNTQIVSNYLKCLKENKITECDLIYPGITPEDLIKDARKKIIYKKTKKELITALDPQILSQEECQNLILEYININQPTYYQITSFINILAVQFKKFNQNYILNAHNLKISTKEGSLMRQLIIENFIKITKYFTEGAFTNLIKKLENSSNVKYGYYDKEQEQKENEKAVNNLAEDDHHVVSFNSITNTLVFFHEGVNESFSIITNKKPEEKEYQDFLALKNCQAILEKDKLKFLPAYNSPDFTKKQFLEELKDILDVKNPVEMTNEEKNKDNNIKDNEENKEKLLSLEKITENYVITADNFLKMVLILLRIRLNIPAINFETG